MAGAQVAMDRLDWANPAKVYRFPTVKAAQRFADHHREKAPGRRIVVITDAEVNPGAPVSALPEDDDLELLSEDDDLVGLS